MSLDQAVANLARKVRDLKPIIETEEATKTAFIIPFISEILGYDVTDPREVIPEYTADVGTKKGAVAKLGQGRKAQPQDISCPCSGVLKLSRISG